jgi:hypothetical protein
MPQHNAEPNRPIAPCSAPSKGYSAPDLRKPQSAHGASAYNTALLQRTEAANDSRPLLLTVLLFLLCNLLHLQRSTNNPGYSTVPASQKRGKAHLAMPAQYKLPDSAHHTRCCTCCFTGLLARCTLWRCTQTHAASGLVETLNTPAQKSRCSNANCCRLQQLQTHLKKHSIHGCCASCLNPAVTQP